MSEIDAAELARLRECVAASGWEIGFGGKLYPVLALLDDIWTAKLDAAVAERDTARALLRHIADVIESYGNRADLLARIEKELGQ